jgi:hypothetical protein
MNLPSQRLQELIKAELEELDKSPIFVNGIVLKPSQCYHYDLDPAHILYNTNCPDLLKEQIEHILAKYLSYESRTQQ